MNGNDIIKRLKADGWRVKRVRGSRFAKLDTLFYSPLCLLLASGVALVALRNGA